MLKHRHIDKIAVAAVILAVVIAALFMQGESLGLQKSHRSPGYVDRLFDAGTVHSIDLFLSDSDWENMLEHPRDKEYVHATVIIDGEKISNVGLRIKGSNSLNQILKYGSQRFSLKIEFDHFVSGKSYFGLDKLSLQTSFQDNAYMKDFFTYDMMAKMGVPSPLSSYAFVRVNDEDWGLFVAVEEPEDAFVRRNFGANRGQLYKPEYKKIDDDNHDVYLIYTGDEFEKYDNIFRKAVFPTSDADKARLIEALRILSTGENFEEAVDLDTVLRYFAVQTFVVNLDGYLGRTGHNYFLYEKDGKISMLPWDYNLAYATYALGMPDPIDDSTLFVNYPINTPAPLQYMSKRPLFFELMKNTEVVKEYHARYDEFLRTYMESGYFEEKVEFVRNMIAPYVERDPTKFASTQDFHLAVDTFKEFCLLRARSVRGQLEGTIPSTFKSQRRYPEKRIDASHIRVPDLGDFEDMRRLIDGRLPE